MTNLHYDPIDQKWSLRISATRWFLWEGDPFDRSAAEQIARSLIRRFA
jgi:hypothetical protein